MALINKPFLITKPNEIVVAKLGSPLAIGVGVDEHFITSDASPFIEFAKQAVYLEDEELHGYKKR